MIVKGLTTLDKNRKHWIIFFPVSFMLRRIIFAVSVVVFPQQIFLQISC